MDCQSDLSKALAYFFFDFNDITKCESDGLIRSILAQLSTHSVASGKPLAALRSKFQSVGQPSRDQIIETLKEIVKELGETFVLIDALDECTDKDKLLDLFCVMAGWNVENLHVLVTSRNEPDIELAITRWTTKQISLQADIVNFDIHIHIHEKLQSDARLKKWPKTLRVEIEKTLMSGADGM